MSVNIHKDGIIRVLRQEISLLESLYAALMQAHDALRTNQTEVLAQQLKRNQELLTELSQTERDREERLKAAGFDITHGGLAGFFDACIQDPLIPELRRRLLGLAEDCARQNRINQLVTNQAQRHTRHILSIMRGEGPATNSYLSSGEHDNETISGTLGVA